MGPITIHARVGADGVLKLVIPLDPREAGKDVEVVVRTGAEAKQSVGLGWPDGYFDATFGSLADDPIGRPDQGQLEPREQLE